MNDGTIVTKLLQKSEVQILGIVYITSKEMLPLLFAENNFLCFY